MNRFSRREFIARGAAGLAALGLPGGGLLLAQEAPPTPPSGDLGDYGKYLEEEGLTRDGPPKDGAPTEDNILGPFHRKGAPYRAKITPPLEPGVVLLIGGRVWSHATKKPLAGATIDIWQANAAGRYDNDDPKTPPAEGVFVNRARLVTDEQGSYEYETIRPGRYRIGLDVWRPSHIHYMVRHPDHATLVTQLYFEGDPQNDADRFIKRSLIIELAERKTQAGQTYEAGSFDIVLAAG